MLNLVAYRIALHSYTVELTKLMALSGCLTPESCQAPPKPEINTGLLIAGSSGGGNQTCSRILVLFSMYIL